MVPSREWKGQNQKAKQISVQYFGRLVLESLGCIVFTQKSLGICSILMHFAASTCAPPGFVQHQFIARNFTIAQYLH